MTDFAPCPLCHQYSHSIGEDRIAEAFNHFQMMYAHPIRGTPMGHIFDEETRDAAHVLLAAIRASSTNAPPPAIGGHDG